MAAGPGCGGDGAASGTAVVVAAAATTNLVRAPARPQPPALVSSTPTLPDTSATPLAGTTRESALYAGVRLVVANRGRRRLQTANATGGAAGAALDGATLSQLQALLVDSAYRISARRVAPAQVGLNLQEGNALELQLYGSCTITLPTVRLALEELIATARRELGLELALQGAPVCSRDSAQVTPTAERTPYDLLLGLAGLVLGGALGGACAKGWRLRRADGKEVAQSKFEVSARQRRAQMRAEARRAEEKLKGAGGSPGEMAKPKGGVALLKGLYVSRVGKAPPVKWNCVPNEQNARGEGSLLVEARTRPLRNRYAYVTRQYPSHQISHTS